MLSTQVPSRIVAVVGGVEMVLPAASVACTRSDFDPAIEVSIVNGVPGVVETRLVPSNNSHRAIPDPTSPHENVAVATSPTL